TLPPLYLNDLKKSWLNYAFNNTLELSFYCPFGLTFEIFRGKLNGKRWPLNESCETQKADMSG
ncbi:MAG: hypothetical protein WA131_03900, partial [Desulfitobacteriaceae bacterium]